MKNEDAIREKPEMAYPARYLGGHRRFPKEEHSMVLIFPDRIEVSPPGPKIPYSAMTDIKTSTAARK